MPTPRPNAVSYLRVSSVGQVRGDGFPRQRAAIARFAAKSYELVDEFADSARGRRAGADNAETSSQNELAHRPGLAAAFERVENNGVKVVIVERADRLARDLMVQEILVNRFQRAGVTVLTADGQDLTSPVTDPTRTLVRQVLGAIAQFEKSGLVLKLAAARDRASATTGRRIEGKKAFGTHPAHPEEAETLARLLALRASGHSLQAIADTLNADGRPTRHGKNHWKPGSVHAILKRHARRRKKGPKEPRPAPGPWDDEKRRG